MKLLITGAAGFIGGHLAEYYQKRGHELILVDNFSHPSKNPIKSIVKYADVRYYNDIAPYIEACDVVFHLAAQIHVDKSIKNPEETLDTNVKGTLNILEACRKYNKRLIFASTSEVYGTNVLWNKITGKDTLSMTEKHELNPQSPYAASKLAAEKLCYSYVFTYQTDITILRNFNTFGPWQNDGSEGVSYGAVIGIFTRAALKNEPLTIFGDGEQERDYIYIDDCIKAYDFILNTYNIHDNKKPSYLRYKGLTFNVGSGSSIRIIDLAKKIINYTQSKSEIKFIDSRPGEVMCLRANMDYIKEKGLKINFNFDNNLKKYIDWYKQYGIN